jgi:hypothetical protein
MLGVAFALLIEMTDRRVRSPHDVAEAVQAPLLAVLMDDRGARRKKIGFGLWVRRPAVAAVRVSPKVG